MPLKNGACIKYSMAFQAYKVVTAHSHKISGWTILSRLLHTRAPRLVWIIGGVQCDLATLAFKQGEQLDFFLGGILTLHQEINVFHKVSLQQDVYFRT